MTRRGSCSSVSAWPHSAPMRGSMLWWRISTQSILISMRWQTRHRRKSRKLCGRAVLERAWHATSTPACECCATSTTATAAGGATGSGACMTVRIRRRWRWHSGKLCRRKKEARSATGLWSTDARSVLRGRHRTVNGVCSRISVRRTA